MGAGMSRGRTPHKPRAAAVTPDDPEVVRRKDEQKDPSTITPVAVVDTPKIPEVEEDPGEAPKPRTADDASSDTDPEWTGAAKLECGKRDEKDSSTSMSLVEVLKKPTVEVLREALKTDEPMEVQTLNINNTNSQLDDRASGSKSVISAKGGTTTAKKLQVAGKGKLVVGKEDEQKEVEEAKSVIYAQGESQTVKMTGGTRTAKKGPYLIAAEMEASTARTKVEHLRLAAIKMKHEGVKPIEKLSKVDRWASDASDRRVLSDYLEALDEAVVAMNGDPCGFVPHPRLHRFRINPRLNVSPAHLSERKQLVKPGVDLVMIRGSFAVPSTFISGNCHIDGMNFVLFDTIMSVNSLLASAQDKSTNASFGLDVVETEDEKADFRAAVQELRKTARHIRNSVLLVGGLPIREPTSYWREAFPDVMP